MTWNFYLTSVIFVIVITSVFSIMVSMKYARAEYAPDKIRTDISVDKMKELECNVSAFLRSHDLYPGTSIDLIAEKLNIVKGHVVNYQKDQAFLSEMNPNGKMVVTFTNGLTPEEKNFAFAHECAHLVNNDEAPIARPTGHGKPEIEQYADYTAAALLMPIEDVYFALSYAHYTDATAYAKTKLIKKLSRKYHVSYIDVIRRINEVYAIKAGE